MITYKEFGPAETEQVKELYRAEDWQAYLQDDEALKRAYANSLFCLGAYHQGKLIGLVRCVGDGEHIVLVQDLIVAPAYQRKKIGSTLFQRVLEQYKHVRMLQVNTDIEDERANGFYQAFGMKPISTGNMICYFRTM